ncbi:hypothetical protein [Prosthecomicrobium hirschii]|jgi:hypothetical protein|uniref:Amidase n=1 Tax=Prosthecodimorpha hirschii TaxID=665126 RepID=A0A0P6VNW9_9HYPH|nr:hypothetical protein [Prosthecomicrobium hirschii]KPL53539.1 hypothetical protein ABB55_16060 [Prosthecomicrobium hirschii]MCW1842632.1 radical SAM protein [Prosthecomicrobium hirschii]TPQ49362.1 hypothetical protein C2U72_18890 [Prosthecomicrobium hirschii]
MPDPITKEAFAAIVADRGLTLSPERFEEFYALYPLVREIRARLRNPRGYDAEPASIFSPGAF